MNPTGTSNHIDNLEHHSGLRAKKVIPFVNDGTGNAVMQITKSLAIRYVVDSAVSTTFYLGKAAPGTLTSAANWQIMKISTASGTITTWADGNSDFDNIWDNRQSLTYL